MFFCDTVLIVATADWSVNRDMAVGLNFKEKIMINKTKCKVLDAHWRIVQVLFFTFYPSFYVIYSYLN